MSITSEIQRIKNNITNAYVICNTKGATMPATLNSANLADCISSISVGSVSDSGGKYLVQVIDYDGTVLKSDHLDAGETFTLPDNPTNTGLTFQSWSSPVTITNGTITVPESDVTIGPTYTTTSGLSEFDITVTTKTGYNVTLNMDGTKNWGDGTSDTLTSHTYSRTGDYTITCNGTSITGNLFGTSYYFAKNARLANVTSLPLAVFAGNSAIKTITLPSGITSIPMAAFTSCSSLKSIILPSGVTSIGTSAFNACYFLINIAIPNSITTISDSVFWNCGSLVSITIPSGITVIDSNLFSDCSSLKNISIPSGVTNINSSAFVNCRSLTGISVPSGVTSIEQGTFNGCNAIVEYDFTNHISVPTLSNKNAFTGINGACQIKVPLSLESAWKTATNWSTYADYIVGV